MKWLHDICSWVPWVFIMKGWLPATTSELGSNAAFFCIVPMHRALSACSQRVCKWLIRQKGALLWVLAASSNQYPSWPLGGQEKMGKSICFSHYTHNYRLSDAKISRLKAWCFERNGTNNIMFCQRIHLNSLPRIIAWSCKFESQEMCDRHFT